MTKADKEGQRKAPILRFKGFTDDWEHRKLGKQNKITMGQSPSSKNYTDNSQDWILIQGNADLKNGKVSPRIYTSQLTKKADIGDIILTVRAPVGEVAITDYNAVLGRGVAAIKGNLFIYFALEKFKANNKWNMYSSGSTFDSITGKDLNNLPLFFPSETEENKIGELLNKLDNLLTLYERKLKLLSQVKKYFLDNLFAEKEYPNLRFKGFTDAWEQRKLENLSEHKSGTSIEKYFSSDGLYKVISIGSYGVNNEYIDQGIRAVKNKATESKLVRNGQLTMVLNDKTANGNLIGRCLLISKDNEFIVNQRTEIIIPGPDLNENYAYYYLNGPFRNKVKKIAQGGTQIYVNYSSVKRQKINYPIKDEQIKISKLLKIIKNLIILYENKQQHLTEIKNTLLNTMFI